MIIQHLYTNTQVIIQHLYMNTQVIIQHLYTNTQVIIPAPGLVIAKHCYHLVWVELCPSKRSVEVLILDS